MATTALREIQATQPGCCQSPRLRDLLEEFLMGKGIKTRWSSLRMLRNFAQSQNLPRKSWPRAVEQLFQLPPGEAFRQYDRHRRSTRLRMKASGGGGTRRGTSLHGLSRFLRDHGLIDWSFPHANKMKAGEAWKPCAPSFRAKAEEWLDSLRVLNYANCTISSSAGYIRRLGEYLKEREIDYWAVDCRIVSDWIKSLINRGTAEVGMT
jgi:hypothetical protein